MGLIKSSRADESKKVSIISAGGRETIAIEVVESSGFVETEEDYVMIKSNFVVGASTSTEETESDEEHMYDSDEESYDVEEIELDSGLEERMIILAEAAKLKNLAKCYYHPEDSLLESNITVSRCFFDRYSAPENDLEREEILNEALELKRLANIYIHPENELREVHAFGYGRNYFDRASAPEVVSEEIGEILNDAFVLKKYAIHYAHPEMVVDTVDPTAFGKNYFVHNDDILERDTVLDDMKSLKKFAMDYSHPERPVAVEDPSVFGRNYYNRDSSVETITLEESNERDLILNESANLLKNASNYAHPEVPIENVDATTFGRNYFYDDADIDERDHALEDALMLKKYAQSYLHPEFGINEVDDPTVFGRNYYERPSVLVTLTQEEAIERAAILEETAKLKKYAVHYAHPERKVECTDPTLFGRKYFDDVVSEKKHIFEDLLALKKAAKAYLHPEASVEVKDTCLFGRNYFERPSAPEVLTKDEADERVRILEESEKMKKAAFGYSHPEAPVKDVNPTVFGRNYFKDGLESNFIMDDIMTLKKYATYYLHPEKEIVCSDSALFGRNYFNRASAPGITTKEEADERAEILADVKLFKKSAHNFAHPEMCVTHTDPTLFGHNYFDSGESVVFEYSSIMEDMEALKKLAMRYAHPEVEVKVSDATIFGRNYYERPSASNVITKEEADEKDDIFTDIASLRKSVRNYTYPEKVITVNDSYSFGRNYFNNGEEIPDNEILEDIRALSKFASYYLHPERTVSVSESTIFGRNYFSRSSAPKHDDDREDILSDAMELKKIALRFSHPEAPVELTDPTIFGKSHFKDGNAAEFDEERYNVLQDALALKKLAMHYSYPEVPVTDSVPSASARNYFHTPCYSHDDRKHITSEKAEETLEHESSFKSSQLQTCFNRSFEFDHDPAEAHDELFEFFDMDDSDVVKRKSLYSNPMGSVSFADFGHVKDIYDNEGENEDSINLLSKSPSCVMLFGMTA